jgi:7,8-dihydropterin-6-yl-methyl-4-(beta-D-ribofuranosyl)aminobenzene 5'-phosphate synthase
MIKIKVLLENNSIDKRFKSSHGLSVFIEYNDKNILLDVGPDNNYFKNAIVGNIDLSKINHLFLSYNHIDHTGGINQFFTINQTSDIYIMDNIHNKYFINVLFFKYPINTKLKKKYFSRIIQLKDDLVIDNNICFLKNVSQKFQKPTFNKELFMKCNGNIINDTFDHEGILVLEDHNELLVFNSCSHNGILNTLETVKKKIPTKKIRCYLGGLHLFNPPTKVNESKEYLDYLVKWLKDADITIYTGHCTGKYSLQYLKENLGNKIKEINEEKN